MSRLADTFQRGKGVPHDAIRHLRPAIRALYAYFEPTLIALSPIQNSQTEDFFSGKLSHEKMDFLVNNGFAEICALSYFFEENCLGKKEIAIVGNRVLRTNIEWSLYSSIGLHDPAERAENRVGLFDIEARHLADFPCVIPSDSSDIGAICWPAKPACLVLKKIPFNNGFIKYEYVGDPNHLHADFEAFKKLKDHNIFFEKSYKTFLKVVSTSNEVFFNCLKESLSRDGENLYNILFPTLILVYEKIGKKKFLLSREMIACEKFIIWFQKLSQEFIQNNIKDRCGLREFTCDVAKEKIKEIFLMLSILMSAHFSDVSQSAVALNAVSMYNPLVGLRSVLLDLSEFFFASAEKTEEKAALFVLLLRHTLNMFRRIPLFVANGDQSDTLSKMLAELDAVTTLFWRDFSLTEELLSSEKNRHIALPKTSYKIISSMNAEIILENLLLWLQRTDPLMPNHLQNRGMILFILRNTYRQHEENNRSVLQKATSSANLLFSSASSFFLRSSSKNFLATQQAISSEYHSKLKELIDEVAAGNEVTEFMEALRKLLSCKEADVALFSKAFVKNLVAHFIEELLAIEIFNDVKNNFAWCGDFAGRLRSLVQSYRCDEIENLLMQSMQAKKPPVCDVGEWVEVEEPVAKSSQHCA